jgi:hypothetical protein
MPTLCEPSLQLHARTHAALHARPTSLAAERVAVARTARCTLAAGDRPATSSVSGNQRLLRVSESAAVRSCESAAVTGDGLSSLATANWVSGTEPAASVCSTVATRLSVLLIRQ